MPANLQRGPHSHRWGALPHLSTPRTWTSAGTLHVPHTPTVGYKLLGEVSTAHSTRPPLLSLCHAATVQTVQMRVRLTQEGDQAGMMTPPARTPAPTS